MPQTQRYAGFLHPNVFEKYAPFSIREERKMQADDLGDRMKMYEGAATTRFTGEKPVCARLDGRGFSKYTKDFKKPFDPKISGTMAYVTKELVGATNATIGYTQSDEITLIWKEKPFFDGKIMKMVSVLASMASVGFNDTIVLPYSFGERKALFDCRVWEVPNLDEAADVLLWRALDAKKNAMSSACRTKYTTAEMFGKSYDDMHQMLENQSVYFDDYSVRDREGAYFARVSTETSIQSSLYDHVPEIYRTGDVVIRNSVEQLVIPFPLAITNRVGVFFNQESPALKD